MKIIDWYILKRFFTTFLLTIFILIPIAVAIDISEKIDNFLEHPDLSLYKIIDEYYKNFVIYYANTFMPLALFIAIILFTTKLSNNTEIIAITNSKVSFIRLLYPYFLAAVIISILSLVMNHFIVPNSSQIRENFEREYFKSKRQKDELNTVKEFSLQLTDSTYVFISSYNSNTNSGFDFTSEVYDGLKLKSKLASDRIRYNKKDSVFTLTNWRKRIIFENKDRISSGYKKDTVFDFTPKDLIYKSILSQEMTSDELLKFIRLSKNRGVKNLNAFLVEFHKRTSLPFSTFILTIIAVSLAYKKRKGGLGINLSVGFGTMFLYIFLMKISEVLGGAAGVNSLVYAWTPNLFFGLLSIYLYYKAKSL